MSNAKTIFEVLEDLRASGYENVIFVVGQDRMDDFKVALKPYVKEMGFKSFALQSAGKRDPDSDDDTVSMSASQLRDAVVKGDFKTFASGLSDLLSPDQKKDLYKLVGRGLDIKKKDK